MVRNKTMVKKCAKIDSFDWKSFKNLEYDEIIEMISSCPAIFNNLRNVFDTKMKSMN